MFLPTPSVDFNIHFFPAVSCWSISFNTSAEGASSKAVPWISHSVIPPRFRIGFQSLIFLLSRSRSGRNRSAMFARAKLESGCQLYSRCSAMLFASSIPYIFESRYSEASIPEESPADVMIFPLSTYLLSIRIFVFGACTRKSSINP